jgi:hypothetical protein
MNVAEKSSDKQIGNQGVFYIILTHINITLKNVRLVQIHNF